VFIELAEGLKFTITELEPLLKELPEPFLLKEEAKGN
jgi:hypothetical protein